MVDGKQIGETMSVIVFTNKTDIITFYGFDNAFALVTLSTSGKINTLADQSRSHAIPLSVFHNQTDPIGFPSLFRVFAPN